MQDIRLKKVQYEFGGETVELVCNMNVLADVEEAFGSLGEALARGHNVRTSLTFLAAMLNEWEDAHGRPKRHSVSSVGRQLSAGALADLNSVVMPLVQAALTSEDAEPAPDPGEPAEDGEKKA